jgi:hypothetical protein
MAKKYIYDLTQLPLLSPGIHVRLLIWAHELTKNQGSLAFLPPFCVCLCSKPFSLQLLCNHLGFQKAQN